MSAAPLPKIESPIPSDLPKYLPQPKTPWMISADLFDRMNGEYKAVSAAGKTFVAVPVTNKDPEYAFVMRYFEHQKPARYGIKKILCIHNPDQCNAFQGSLRGMEAAAKKFPPSWNKEEPVAHRAQTIERWKSCVAPFSPFQTQSSERTDLFSLCKVVPLWHGSHAAESICEMGFTYFGKHHKFEKSKNAGAVPGSKSSTDIGFFGSGIYFTNSARYASMYGSKTLLLGWVSMMEPYPVVNDVMIPNKGKDMLKLEGQGAYQTYNAHYIPVTSINPKDPENMIYHPCHSTELPAWDEYVVFQPSQTLLRFVVELEVEFPAAVSASGIAVEALTNQVLLLLDNAEVQSDREVCDLLYAKSDSLLNLNPKSPLSAEDMAFYNRAANLLDSAGKVRTVIKKQLFARIQTAAAPIAKAETDIKSTNAHAASSAAPPQKSEYDVKSVNAHAPVIANTPSQNEYDAKMEVAGQIRKTVTKSIEETLVQINPFGSPLHEAAARGNLEELKKQLASRNYLHQATDRMGATPLLVAATFGHLDACKILINAGANINAINSTGKNALHCCCLTGKLDVVQFFISYKHLLESKDFSHSLLSLSKSDDSQKSRFGSTPLILAASQGQAKVCELLLKAGANGNVSAGNKGENALHFASENGDLETIRLFLINRIPLESKDKWGFTPLMKAASSGRAQACDFLLKSGANINATPNSGAYEGWTVLHAASHNGDIATIQLFLQNKDLLEKKNKKKETPLLIAASKGLVKVCDLLLKVGADVNAVDSINHTVLYLACRSGDIATIQLFLQFKQLLDVGSRSGETPLWIAAGRGNLKACDLLIKAGAKVNIITSGGETPLHAASKSGDIETIKLFLPYRAQLESKDSAGNTPLMLAASDGNAEACKTLLAARASVDVVDEDNSNVLHLACSSGNLETIQLFIHFKPLLESKDASGKTPLLRAADHQNHESCAFLLKENANVYATDSQRRTVLHLAASNGDIECVNLFLPYRRLLEAKDKEKRTPLLIAASADHLDICKALLKAGANINATDALGLNALAIAKKHESDDLIELFSKTV